MSLLGVDMGTSSCKAVAFSESGAVVASSAAAYVRRGGSDVGDELDAAVFWSSFVEVVRRTAEASKKDKIEALAISAHGETIIPIDDRGEPCGPALLNRDNRSGPQIPAWEQRFGRDAIYAITGLPVHSMYSLPKLLWLKENRAEIFSRARKFVTVADFLLMRMGVPQFVDYTMASRIMGFDIARLNWSEELLGFVGLSSANFSGVLPSGTAVGNLDAEHARALLLEEGVTVVLGGHDQPCGAFGSGGSQAGCAVDSAGSYECVTVVVNEPKNSPASLRYSLNSYPHVVSGKYVLLAFFPSGLVIDWLLENFYMSDRASETELQDAYSAVQDEVEKRCPDPTGICVTPHLIGSDNPHWDLRASLSVSGLRAHHGKYHLYKAVFEGIACELGENLRVLEEVAGPISRCMIFGGGSRWDYGVQIRADVTGRRLERVESSEMACHGAAMLAGVGAGVYRDFDEAVAGSRQATRGFAPSAQMAGRYEGQARRYAALYEGLGKYRALDVSDHAQVKGVGTGTANHGRRR